METDSRMARTVKKVRTSIVVRGQHWFVVLDGAGLYRTVLFQHSTRAVSFYVVLTYLSCKKCISPPLKTKNNPNCTPSFLLPLNNP